MDPQTIVGRDAVGSIQTYLDTDGTIKTGNGLVVPRHDRAPGQEHERDRGHRGAARRPGRGYLRSAGGLLLRAGSVDMDLAGGKYFRYFDGPSGLDARWVAAPPQPLRRRDRHGTGEPGAPLLRRPVGDLLRDRPRGRLDGAPAIGQRVLYDGGDLYARRFAIDRATQGPSAFFGVHPNHADADGTLGVEGVATPNLRGTAPAPSSMPRAPVSVAGSTSAPRTCSAPSWTATATGISARAGATRWPGRGRGLRTPATPTSTRSGGWPARGCTSTVRRRADQRRQRRGRHGTIYAASFAPPSSAALKEDIRPLGGALALVKALAPVRFRYRGQGDEVFGLVAERVREVLPAAVRPLPAPPPELAPIPDEGSAVPAPATTATAPPPAPAGELLGLDLMTLVTLGLGGLKDLAAEVATLRAEVAALRAPGPPRP
jgi:hypothetical protein